MEQKEKVDIEKELEYWDPKTHINTEQNQETPFFDLSDYLTSFISKQIDSPVRQNTSDLRNHLLETNRRKANTSRQYITNNHENRDHSMSKRCFACETNSVDSVFIPCGHSCMCIKCSEESLAYNRKCPICRACVTSVNRVYYS